MAEYEWKPAKLHCNNCHHEWSDEAIHEPVVAEGRVIDWVIASGNAAPGKSCPECGEGTIGAHPL